MRSSHQEPDTTHDWITNNLSYRHGHRSSSFHDGTPAPVIFSFLIYLFCPQDCACSLHRAIPLVRPPARFRLLINATKGTPKDKNEPGFILPSWVLRENGNAIYSAYRVRAGRLTMRTVRGEVLARGLRSPSQVVEPGTTVTGCVREYQRHAILWDGQVCSWYCFLTSARGHLFVARADVVFSGLTDNEWNLIIG